MTPGIPKERIWSALEAEARRAQPQGESPQAVYEAPSAPIEAPPLVIDASASSPHAAGEGPPATIRPPSPVPSTTNAVDASAPVAQAAGNAQAPIDIHLDDQVEPRRDHEAEIARLAEMTALEYARVRKERARALGVQVRVLDDQVKAERNRQVLERLPFKEVEAQDLPVDPAELLDEVVAIIHRFIVLEPEQADAAALWTAHTHVTEHFDISPLALIDAPEKACAKTQFQTLLGRMCHRPLPAANASLSALFRAIELWGPTVLIDEADRFFGASPELHGLVNAGYSRGGCVLRSEPSGDSYVPRSYDVYCAKSIAGIRLERVLPDSTMSRGIVFKMRRKLPTEKVDRPRDAEKDMFDRVQAKMRRFAADYGEQIRQARPPLPAELSDRAADNWAPMFAIASCAGPKWVERARAAALKLSGAGESQASLGGQLLEDIRLAIAKRKGDRIRTADLLEALAEDAERPWATFDHGKRMTPRQLARLLGAYGIRSRTVRLGKTVTPKGYQFADFEDAFARYLPPAKAEPERDNRDGDPPERPQEFCRIEPLGSVPSGEAGDDWPAPPEDEYL